MRLIFAGDVVPIEGFEIEFDECVKQLFQGADYSFVNLECPLTECREKIMKCGPNLRAMPERVCVLNGLGVDCVTLANNHLLDYSGQGVIDTLQACFENGIKTVGAGKNREDAARPLVLEKDGEKVAIVNVAEKEFCVAGETTPGANPLDLIDLMRQLEKARELVADIIVVVHGGLEHVPYPSPESIRLLRFIAEQKNVRAVIRHHPHIIQGREEWRGVPIYYSLGNFYFPKNAAMAPGWWKGLVVELNLVDNRLSERLFRAHVKKGQGGIFSLSVEPVLDEELPRVDEKQIQLEWDSVVSKRKDVYIANVSTPNGFISRVMCRLLKLKFLWANETHRLLIQNYIRCDAHREMLLNAFGGKQ